MLADPYALLAAAHAALDKAVNKCYRDTPFPCACARVAYLFQLYEQLAASLGLTAKPKRHGNAIRPKPLPQGKATPQSEADAAHHYSVQEESPPYRLD